jgi:hypothetical protein
MQGNMIAVTIRFVVFCWCLQHRYMGTRWLKVHKHEISFGLFLQKPNPFGPKGL